MSLVVVFTLEVACFSHLKSCTNGCKQRCQREDLAFSFIVTLFCNSLHSQDIKILRQEQLPSVTP